MAKLRSQFEGLGFEIPASRFETKNSRISLSSLVEVGPEEIDTIIKTWLLRGALVILMQTSGYLKTLKRLFKRADSLVRF